MTDEPQDAGVTDKGGPARRSRGAVAALAIPLGLLGGVLFGVVWLEDIGLGIALGLGAGAVVAGVGSRDWGRPERGVKR
ncbi:hypothetical protein [Streptomyces vilmorinianum]|uniref:hypothetical protein n=1 Tax=Streptomyces vilmorinianum TaxID=3051092 RepID=UPI0010FB4B6B|nr:hypothetical protein [Streptomyces vilmorinianum]